MRKISDDPVRFIVSLKQVKKYGLSPLEQVKRNPEAKLLFPKSKRGGKQCQRRKQLKEMTCFAEVFPPGVKAFVSLRPNSTYSYLLIRSMPFAENISILQERSGGAVRVFVDIKKFPAFKVSAF